MLGTRGLDPTAHFGPPLLVSRGSQDTAPPRGQHFGPSVCDWHRGILLLVFTQTGRMKRRSLLNNSKPSLHLDRPVIKCSRHIYPQIAPVGAGKALPHRGWCFISIKVQIADLKDFISPPLFGRHRYAAICAYHTLAHRGCSDLALPPGSLITRRQQGTPPSSKDGPLTPERSQLGARCSPMQAGTRT